MIWVQAWIHRTMPNECMQSITYKSEHTHTFMFCQMEFTELFKYDTLFLVWMVYHLSIEVFFFTERVFNMMSFSSSKCGTFFRNLGKIHVILVKCKGKKRLAFLINRFDSKLWIDRQKLKFWPLFLLLNYHPLHPLHWSTIVI